MSLELDGVRLSWPDFTLTASISVARGETLVLAGPSGCGKTSLLRAAAGFLPLDEGRILLAGREIGRLPPWERNIGYVFQEANLFPHLSVAGNVAYGPFVQGVPRRERRERVERALELVHMERFRSRRPDTLSGGERQRIAIARALANDPAALFLDEPFSSLDAPLRRDMQEAFCELKSRLDIPAIFVTHDREEAAAVGDRIAIMGTGHIVEEGPVEVLFSQPRSAFSARFLALGTVLSNESIAEAFRTTHSKAESQISSPSSALLIPLSAVSFSGNVNGEGDRQGAAEEPSIQIQGRIVRRRFEGATWLFEVEAGLGERLALRVPGVRASSEKPLHSKSAPDTSLEGSTSSASPRDEKLPDIGDEVCLAIDCRAVIELERDAEENA